MSLQLTLSLNLEFHIPREGTILNNLLMAIYYLGGPLPLDDIELLFRQASGQTDQEDCLKLIPPSTQSALLHSLALITSFLLVIRSRKKFMHPWSLTHPLTN